MLLSVKVKVIKKSNWYEEVNLNRPMSHIIIIHSNTQMWCSCSLAQFGTPQRTPDRKWFGYCQAENILISLEHRPQSRTVQQYVISLEHRPQSRTVQQYVISLEHRPQSRTVQQYVISLEHRPQSRTVQQYVISLEHRPQWRTVQQYVISLEHMPSQGQCNSIYRYLGPSPQRRRVD